MLQDKYLNAIQTTSPHLLRYLIVAVVTNPRRRSLLQVLARARDLRRSAEICGDLRPP